MENTRPAFLLFAEKFLNTPFNFYCWDENLILTKDCYELIEKVKKELYFNFKYKNKRPYRLKRFLFEREYKRFPQKFPDLISKDSFKPENFSLAIGGNFIEKTLLFGYFRKITNPTTDEYLTNSFNRPIIPFSIALEVISTHLEYFISTLSQSKNQSNLAIFEKHYEDVKNLLNIFNYINELYDYSKKENIPFLKSGHLLGFLSGLVIYIENFSREIINRGFATVTMENSLPLLTILNELKENLDISLLCFTMDIFNSLVASLNYRWEILNSRVYLIDQNEYKKGILDFFIDIIFSEKYEIPSKSVIETEFIRISDARKKLEKGEEVSKKKIFIESENFFKLFNLLKNFIKELRADLEPEFDPTGKLLSLKQGFDQFDIPENARIIDPLRHTLNGKFPAVALLDFKNNDEMVIKATYWLYDRISSILETYRITIEGIDLETAKSFVEEVKGLYFPPRNETNEKKIYGNFASFKVYVERLFGTKILQNKYLSIIKEILKVLDKCRIEISKKEKVI